MQITFCIDFLIYTVQSDHDRILLYRMQSGASDLSLLPTLQQTTSVPDVVCVLIIPESSSIKYIKNQLA